MQKSDFVLLLAAGAFAALAATQYCLWHQQRETNAALERVVRALARSERDVPPPSARYEVPASGGFTKAEFRALLREELLAGKASEPAASAPGTDSIPAESVASPESERAFQTAQGLVHNAISARVWGDQQVAELRAVRGQLTPEQLQLVLAELIPAINSQQLRVEAAGMPF